MEVSAKPNQKKLDSKKFPYLVKIYLLLCFVVVDMFDICSAEVHSRVDVFGFGWKTL